MCALPELSQKSGDAAGRAQPRRRVRDDHCVLCAIEREEARIRPPEALHLSVDEHF